jgi:hypothetical protein
VFVCGGRRFSDVETLVKVLRAIKDSTGVAAIIETGDRAGYLAAAWARDLGIPVVSLAADRLARDMAMVAQGLIEQGRPDLAISIQGGSRTAELFDRLARAGVRTYHVADAV